MHSSEQHRQWASSKLRHGCLRDPGLCGQVYAIYRAGNIAMQPTPPPISPSRHQMYNSETSFLQWPQAAPCYQAGCAIRNCILGFGVMGSNFPPRLRIHAQIAPVPPFRHSSLKNTLGRRRLWCRPWRLAHHSSFPTMATCCLFMYGTIHPGLSCHM